MPFDCIAISEKGVLCKLSVKYRKKDKDNTAVVLLKSVWSDRKGVHRKPHDMYAYDATAIYCPDTNTCYYIRNDEIGGTRITLRFNKTKNNQTKGIMLAANYTDAKRLFCPRSPTD